LFQLRFYQGGIVTAELPPHSLAMSKMENVNLTVGTYKFEKTPEETKTLPNSMITIQAEPAGRLTRAAIEELMEMLKRREKRILELEKRLKETNSNTSHHQPPNH
jgi:hypothetical protein